MANESTAYGLRPIGLVGSAVNSTGVTQYEIASDNTDAIYQYGICVPLGTSARTGSTDTGSSNSALGVSTVATTATLPLRIVGILDDEANSDYTAAGIPLIVRLNAHFNANAGGFASQTTALTTGI